MNTTTNNNLRDNELVGGASATETHTSSEAETYRIDIEDILSTDIIPWYKISDSFPTYINTIARVVGNGLQKVFYICYVIELLFWTFKRINWLTIQYPSTYLETNCSMYYGFSFDNFSHYPIYRNVPNSSFLDCQNSPFYVIAFTFAEFLRVLICLVWLYLIDERFGSLKIRYGEFALKHRHLKASIQFVVTLIMFPINLVLSVILTYIGIPLFVALGIFNWALNCNNFKKCNVAGLVKKDIFFLYILMTVQDVSTISINCAIKLTMEGITSNEDKVLKLVGINLLYYCISHCSVFLIPTMLHILRNHKHFQILINTLTQILPVFLSLWAYGDLLLDIVQTKKYHNFAFVQNLTLNETAYNLNYNSSGNIHSISPLYFIFSLLSFITPVMLCFALIIHNYKGIRILRICNTDKLRSSKPPVRFFCFAIELLIGVFICSMLSVMLFYVVIPLILINHGFNTIKNGGNNEEELIDWDPFKFLSKHSEFQGLLELYGFKNVKAKYLPLLSAMEQIGEATIQTTLTLVYLVNNFDYLAQTDTFLGLPFPVSILSLIFSVVSLTVGLFRISKIYRYFQEEKEALKLLEVFRKQHNELKWIEAESTPRNRKTLKQ